MELNQFKAKIKKQKKKQTFLDRMLKYTLVFSNGRRQIIYHNDYCSGEAMRRSKGDKLSPTDSRIVILYSLTSFSLSFNIKQFFLHSPRLKIDLSTVNKRCTIFLFYTVYYNTTLNVTKHRLL